MQTAKNTHLRYRIKVDQDVPADHQLHVRDRSILGQIAASEDQQTAQLAIYPRLGGIRKVLSPPLGTYTAQTLRRVLPTARNVQCVLINVSGVDLNVEIRQARTKELRY